MTPEPAPCRSCGQIPLEDVLSLGPLPLANRLLTAEQLAEPEPTYPLDLVLCPRCTLAQLTVTLPPDQLFRDYVYFSSYADTAVSCAGKLVGQLVSARRLGPASLAIEIASNDGYLLQHYLRHGVPVLGIEPALNVAKIAIERGIPTLTEFFGAALADQLRQDGKRADVIHANNVLAHVADLNGFVAGLGALLKEGGCAVVEVPYVKDLIERIEFDTIYHEHLCYFSLTALAGLFNRHGLRIEDVQHLTIHGGSLRLFLTKGTGVPQVPASVQTLIAGEATAGLTAASYYRAFASRVENLGETLRACLAELKAKGARIAAYGASAKGTTLLNYFDIGRETIDFVVDRNPAKQGRYTPGTHLPVHPPQRLIEEMPEFVLLLAWNFADEVLAQQQEYRHRGGKFIIPIPEPEVV